METIEGWGQALQFFDTGNLISLLAALMAVATARGIHRDRLRQERKERMRRLLGELMAAVNSRNRAEEHHQTCYAELRHIPTSALLPQMSGDNGGRYHQATAREQDALSALQQADGLVESLLFQIATNVPDREKEVNIAAQILNNAKEDESGEYEVAHNYLLAVARKFFGDSKADGRQGKQEMRVFGPVADKLREKQKRSGSRLVPLEENGSV